MANTKIGELLRAIDEADRDLWREKDTQAPEILIRTEHQK
jgi:hypothetical protein